MTYAQPNPKKIVKAGMEAAAPERKTSLPDCVHFPLFLKRQTHEACQSEPNASCYTPGSSSQSSSLYGPGQSRENTSRLGSRHRTKNRFNPNPHPGCTGIGPFLSFRERFVSLAFLVNVTTQAPSSQFLFIRLAPVGAIGPEITGGVFGQHAQQLPQNLHQ